MRFKYGVDGKLVEVHTGLKDKMAFVAIVNYGKIIPAEDLDKIFDKFLLFLIAGLKKILA